MDTGKRPSDEFDAGDDDGSQCKKFVWLKKQKRDIERGLTPDELARQEAERRLRNRLQIQKLERQRQEREAQREAKLREKERGQQDKEREALGDWEGKTRRFHLGQAKERALLRAREGRAEVLDFILLETVIAVVDPLDKSVPVYEGDLLILLESLAYEEAQQLISGLEEQLELEDDQDCLNFIHAAIAVSHAQQDEGGAGDGGLKAVKDDVEGLLKGKTVSQLCVLEASIKGKLSGASGPVDVSYWEGLLMELKRWKGRGLFRETRQILSDRRAAAGIRGEPIHRGPSSSVADDNTGVEEEDAEASNAAAFDASVNWDPHPDALRMYNAEAHRRVGKDEIPFNAEADDIPRSPPAWSANKTDAPAPVKPRFFNRVRMNYNWNRYNQTHYDADNPPPKVVQGYRFNIFYPALKGHPTPPSYRVEPDPASADMRILRFSAGPPYEDLLFRISDEEWDMSYRAGFKCTFEGQTLRLHLWFKSERYRR
jgi:hypothetical protein